MGALLAAESPDVVLTHWPLDTHFDHQVASLLTLAAHRASGETWPVYFYEVESGYQTMGFNPNAYVDITPTHEKKKAALLHKSQDAERFYRQYHEIMETFRGREIRVAAAEAFVRLPVGHGAGKLPAASLRKAAGSD